MATAGKITGLAKKEQALASRSIAEERTVGGAGEAIKTSLTEKQRGEQSYLQQLKYAIQVGDVPVKERMAVTWFRSIVERAKISLARETVPSALKIDAAQQGTLTGRLIPGRMYFFMYNPKHKATLPYYDMFPLVLPFKFYRNGFCGLNFHYLSIPMRIDLLRRLDAMFEEDAELYRQDSHSKGRVLAMSWSRIKGMRGVKPCVKRYRAMYVYSNFLKIGLEDMVVASLLPIERFYTGDVWSDMQQRVQPRSVWNDSRRAENYG